MATVPLSPDVPDGQIILTRHEDRSGCPWYLVQIGRSRHVKRFNLRIDELLVLDKHIHQLPEFPRARPDGG